MESDHDHVSSQEAFEYTYRLFIEAVAALSKKPAQQVMLNGNYNTAFELIHEARAGEYLIHNPSGYLSEDQEHAVRDFIEALNGLPFLSHSGREVQAEGRLHSNLVDMLHPSWVPIRAKAERLLQQLAAPTAMNRTYFRSLDL